MFKKITEIKHVIFKGSGSYAAGLRISEAFGEEIIKDYVSRRCKKSGDCRY
jgi:predicted nucleic acid-binding Zn ribbon protein